MPQATLSVLPRNRSRTGDYVRRFLLRSVLPLAISAAVIGVHFIWQGFFLEQDPVQDRWVAVPGQTDSDWFRRYIATGGYWFGYSYALALAFAVVALRRYRERRLCSARNLAIGGVTLSGLLAVAGCYLIGCCGSPMLIVYLNLFGTAFLPLAKPLMAGITTLTIGLAWLWMLHAERKTSSPQSEAPSPQDGCGCGPAIVSESPTE